MGSSTSRQQTITVQYVGVAEQDLDAMQSMFDVLGQQLSVTLELQRESGELVLLQLQSGTRVTAEQINAVTGGRPAVFITTQSEAVARLSSAAERFAVHQRVLLPQLTDLPLVRRKSALRSAAATPPRESPWDSASSTSASALSTTASTGFDSRPSSMQSAPGEADIETDPAQLELLKQVLRGLADPKAPSVTASYGPNANLLFDFEARLV